MRYYHRHSLFPLAIIALSLLLAGFMFWSLQKTNTSSTTIQEQEVVSVNPDVYKADLKKIVQTFEEKFSAAQDDLDRLVATQTALTGLLGVRVPTEFKDLHLGLAIAMNQLEAALKSENRLTDKPLAAIEALVLEYHWLSE
jgi:hypothetical protein